MIAVTVTPQLVADGVVNGLVYGLVGMGVVLIHRSTRVISFAVGAMGLPGTALVALLAVQYDVPYPLALLAGLLVGTAFGTVSELIVVRRLFRAPRVILLVATIGLSQVALAATLAMPKPDDVRAPFPTPFSGRLEVGDVVLSGPAQTIVVVVPLVALVLGWLLTRTMFGKAVAAAADNPDLLRLSGISPKLASTAVWTVAGFVATLSIVLIAGRVGGINQVATLGPATLARGLVVAVVAGMASFPRSVVAGVVLGVVESVLAFNILDQPGLIDTVLLVAVLVAVFLQSRRPTEEGATTFSFAPRVRPVPEAIADRWWARHLGHIVFVVAVVVGILVPLVVTTPSRSYLYASILGFALAALSVSVVTGWSGQLSLGQMGFAGVGALGTAMLVRGQGVVIGLPTGTYLHLSLGPTSLVVAMLVMTVVCALLAALIGLGALRVRGLLLAVSTFVFAYAAQQHLFRTDLMTGGAQPPIRLPRGELAGIDLTVQRTYYWFVLAVTTVVVVLVARLRQRAPWRTMVAVRDNQATASAYTVGATRTKLSSFALAGGVAGLAGCLLGALTQNINTRELFVVGDSLSVVSMAVIGGLGSVAGPIVGALWVRGLPAFFPDNDVVPLLTSGIGLLVLLLYFPGGLVQLAYSARDALYDRLAARAPAPAEPPRPTTWARPERPAEPDATGPALEARDMVVAFGGVRAVDGASISVARGEVVGLIGTNGAGKSTLFNAIGGFVPSHGEVHVLGQDVSRRRPHQRARAGLGRTFQAASLFPELTVRQTVMVALEARRRSGILGPAVGWPPAGRDERRKRSEADEILGFLGLGRYADAQVSDLSTGTRRIVELAGLLAVDARVLCLDEPTAGVAQRETEAFGPLILALRAELDASVLVIEHDMPLIMSMSDRVYCLEAGRVIAEGAPDVVRSDPGVVASYLGTDERAIIRSDASRPRRRDTH